MGVEVATYIADLTPTTPGASDLQNQGDDHLRLVKSVLQNSFPGLGKAIYFPSTVSKSADFSVVAADMNKTFLVTTTGGVINMTLPSTLAAGDAGWECFLMKATADVNPVMVKPASGTLTSGAIPALAAARRCIPFKKVSCFWTGTAFVISRATESGPVGTAIEYHGATLPYGFEWPNGQTLASASTLYPEYNTVIGSGATLDKRSRLGIPLDNLGGSAAGRVGTVVTGTAIGNVAGTETVTLSSTQIPSHTHALTDLGHTHLSTSGNEWSGSAAGTAAAGASVALPTGTNNLAGTLTSSASTGITIANTGGGLAHSNLPPVMVVAQLLVTE